MKRLHQIRSLALLTTASLACSNGSFSGSGKSRHSVGGQQTQVVQAATTDTSSSNAEKQARAQAQLVDYGQFLLSDLQTKQEELEEIKKRIPATEEELMKSPDLIDDLNRIESEISRSIAYFEALGVEAGQGASPAGKTAAAAALALADGAPAAGSALDNPIMKFIYQAGRLLSGIQAWLHKCMGPSDGETVETKPSGGGIIGQLLSMITNLIKAIVKFITSCLFGISKGADARLVLFDNVTFYDEKAKDLAPTPDGVVRLSNFVVARRVTPEELENFGSDMQLKFIENAGCATYDGGNDIKLAIVPKTKPDSLENKDIKRIEIGRFFNPFTDKNVQPTQISYKFKIGHLARVLRNPELNKNVDFWIEAGMYNGTSDAVGKVAGCTETTYETFTASVELISNSRYIEEAKPFLLPLVPEAGVHKIRSLTPGATDEPGKAKKTFSFDLAQPIKNASIFLTVSSHGAHAGGEEYNRRWHYLYFDGQEIKRILPGEPSCEPYRHYNTLVNGIYALPTFLTPRTWCPGAATPARRLGLGDLAAGKHSFTVDVPDFTPGTPEAQNDIPTSVYLQGDVVE
ncbi:MAG: hypothetical protein FJ146_16600 [Deltaproteobacteria bacterium]|nr:hypothetical protein [Deltaproteobacteria bacterium]